MGTGIAMPQVASVRALPARKVVVVWSSGNKAGQTEEIDLAAIIASYTIFTPLRKGAALFRTVKVLHGGSAIGWASADLELAAETLELSSRGSRNARKSPRPRP